MRFENELGRPSLGRKAKTRAVNTRLNASQMEQLEERARQEHTTPSDVTRRGVILINAWPHVKRAVTLLNVIFETVYRGEILAACDPEFGHVLHEEMADIYEDAVGDELFRSEGKSAERAAQNALALFDSIRQWVSEADVEAGVEHTLQVIDSVVKPK